MPGSFSKSAHFLVVGSGPSGVSAASALLARGFAVTLIDAGTEIEKDRESQSNAMAKTRPEEWTAHQKKFVRGDTRPTSGGIPIKLSFGSDFHYRGVEELFQTEAKGVEVFSSLAKGGLSNVWGAAVLPYAQEDLEGWPIRQETLKPHYESVMKLFELSAVSDDLEARFPLYTQAKSALSLSAQGKTFFADLENSKDALRGKGITFGRSRLAVRSFSNGADFGCTYCGLCLYGCPYGLIYNSRETLERLSLNPQFRYLPGMLAKNFKETASGVDVTVLARQQGTETIFKGDHLFLGAGLLPTANLVFRSLGIGEANLSFRTSQHFILPLLRAKASPDVTKEALHTLAQLFIEIEDARFGKSPVHLQVYGYSDLYREVLKNMSKGLFPLIGKVLDQSFLSRLLIVQGYFHSDLSAQVQLAYKNTGSLDRFELSAMDNPETKASVRTLLKIFSENKSALKALALSPMLKVSLPGGGSHSGGTFPMVTNPSGFESDLLGRPMGLKRVSLVDSSTFPTIPAPTITLTVMANAHRVAESCAEL